MRISYRTHPPLEALEKGLPIPSLMIGKEDWGAFGEIEYDYISKFNQHKKAFSSHIFKMSGTFETAMNLAHEKLSPLFEEEMSQPLDLAGTLITTKYILMYKGRLANMGKDMSMLLYLFSKDGTALAYVNDMPGEHLNFFAKDPPPMLESSWDPLMFTARFFGYIVYLAIFRKYAEIETKTFVGGEKTVYHGDKTFNDTKVPITFLDSKWFTNLVKSDAFKVRGHFRLQPCGAGLKDKKLIWIDDFVKSGYTAPARKLKEAGVDVHDL